MKAHLLYLAIVTALCLISAKGTGETLWCHSKNANEKRYTKLTFNSTGITYRGAFFKLEDKFENHAIFISKQKHFNNKRGFMIGLSVLQIDMQSLEIEIGSVLSVSKLGNLKVPEIVLLPSIFLNCTPR